MIKLGSIVKDRLTGIKGTAIARTEWLHGCVRITIQPEGVTKEKKAYDSHTADEQQIEVIKEADVPKARVGGPHDEPRRQKDPIR